MATTQPDTPRQPVRSQKHGIIYNVLWGWPWTLVGMLLSSLLLSLLIEFLCMVFLWPEQGAAHSQRMLITESGWLSGEFTRSLLLSEPSVTAINGLSRTYQWAFVDSGVTSWLQTQGQLHGDNDITRQVNVWTGWIARQLHEYLLMAMFVTGVTAIRVIILGLSAPLFVLVAMVAVVEGLSRRDLRRYGAAYESSFVYHHARRLVKPALCVPCMLYLAWPVAVYPNLLLLPAALLFGAAVTVTLASFKKYI
jgi:integrating conjugative element membrane protein (TIGR03747 family)